jgi:hypothetical protein
MWDLSRAEREGHRGGPGSDWNGAAGPAGDCHGDAFDHHAVRAGGKAEVGGRKLPGDDGNPPEKKEVAPSDIASTGSNDVWKHPPAANKIGNEQLADIVAYIKYATTGTKRAVDPADVR